MNRTGLVIVLAIAAVVGVLFGIWPKLDLAISRLAFNPDPKVNLFDIGLETWVLRTRDTARWVIALIAAPAFLSIVGKVLFPKLPMTMDGRAAVVIVLTLGLGPGFVTNTVFKDHWGRSRPMEVPEFGGNGRFTAWWDPRGPCPNNCSFVAGEPSGAFWTVAPAAFVPPQWRALAYAGVLAFGSGIGVLRILGGGHFFTDVVFAGVFMYLVVWAVCWLLFRCRATRLPEGAIERFLAAIGFAIRRSLASLVGAGEKKS
jgi:lipid A 4'-phosphatase